MSANRVVEGNTRYGAPYNNSAQTKRVTLHDGWRTDTFSADTSVSEMANIRFH